MKLARVEFPHAAHFIGFRECLFRRATVVGRVIVSTVGEWRGGQEIGVNRKYETMVFKASGRAYKCGCRVHNGCEIDFSAYNTSADAQRGHEKMVRKWEARQKRGGSK